MSEVTYKVWDNIKNDFDPDLCVDQDGCLFRVVETWGCEIGGVSDYDNIDIERYSIRLFIGGFFHGSYIPNQSEIN